MPETGSHHQILRKEVLALSSEKKHWHLAVREWELIDVKKTNTGRCICGHDVAWDFWIRNIKTMNATHVGSECIKHFEENPELCKDAEMRQKNLKRKYEGKDPVGPCFICGKNTRIMVDTYFCHAKCKKQFKENAKKKEWLKNASLLQYALENIPPADQIDDRDAHFFESIKRQHDDQQGMSDKQAYVVKKILAKYKIPLEDGGEKTQ
jgi:hypothetical protein